MPPTPGVCNSCNAPACVHIKKRVVFFAKDAKNLHPAAKKGGFLTYPHFAGGMASPMSGSWINHLSPRCRLHHYPRKIAVAGCAYLDLSGLTPNPSLHQRAKLFGSPIQYFITGSSMICICYDITVVVRWICFFVNATKLSSLQGWFAAGMYRSFGFSVIGLKSKFREVRS